MRTGPTWATDTEPPTSAKMSSDVDHLPLNDGALIRIRMRMDRSESLVRFFAYRGKDRGHDHGSCRVDEIGIGEQPSRRAIVAEHRIAGMLGRNHHIRSICRTHNLEHFTICRHAEADGHRSYSRT